jgi:hypothetical protein
LKEDKSNNNSLTRTDNAQIAFVLNPDKNTITNLTTKKIHSWWDYELRLIYSKNNYFLRNITPSKHGNIHSGEVTSHL